jgi:hypothetical protein
LVGKVAPKTTISANESEIKLRFGGGLNTRASSDEIDERECCEGSENFDLDLGNTQFRSRLPFDLCGTTPNAAQINGFAQLVATDGTISTIIQAGGNVYKVGATWADWTLVGTCSTNARLRGPRHHIWNLDDVVLISDIAGASPVLQWDGTTLSDVYHNLAGDFKAKYIYVEDERAYYANVVSNSVETPHVLVGSEQSDYSVLTVTDRPSSSLSAADPFYLPMPDLKPINGIAGAFGVLAISTQRGQMFQLTGSSSQDYAMDSLYYGSYADGEEAMTFSGNDIVYGRSGRIESLVATNQYGDVETDDLSAKISDSISTFEGWRLAYSSRHQRVYCQPEDQAMMLVFHKPLADSGLSPWMKWTTSHALDFNPTTMWSMLDPVTGLEHTYMGDSTGSIYKLEGSGASGDGGTTNISAARTSKLFSAPGLSQIFDLHGAVKFRPITGESSSLDLTILWQGEAAFDTTVTMTLAEAEAGALFSGDYYWGDNSVYGSHFEGRLARERFTIAGQGNAIQIVTASNGTENFQINEIYCGFRAAG